MSSGDFNNEDTTNTTTNTTNIANDNPDSDTSNSAININILEQNDLEKKFANFKLLTVDELKLKANDCFKRKEYEDAIKLYTMALEKDPSNAILYGNRSFAYLKTECFGYAFSDATKSIELDKNYIKGYYRRAEAQMALGKFKQALKDFETVMKFFPNDKDARIKYQECKKIVTQKAFEKAISIDIKKKSIVETIDLDSIVVENNYDGPRFDESNNNDNDNDNQNQITLKFVENLIEYFKKEKLLHKKFAYKIILKAKDLFQKCKTLVDIEIPAGHKFTICGDIHGQFYDLLNIFKLNGLPSEKNPYLFNGDVVDRGSFSIECILLLFTFKILYPEHLFIARGNHESETMNKIFGFEGECKEKYSKQMYDLFTETFECLPLAHCLNKKILIMHGGLFNKDNVTLDEIRSYDRFRQPPDDGLMCDILWSDPMPVKGRLASKRGVGCQFGPDITEQFLKLNNLDYIIRSHEVKDDGYEVAHNGKCITVFSAPNYCDRMGNLGAFITFNIPKDNNNDNNNNNKNQILKPNFTTFKEVPHPDKKPMCYSSNLFSMMS